MKKFIKATKHCNVPIEIFVNVDCICSIEFYNGQWYIDIVGNTYKFNEPLITISEEDVIALFQLKAGDTDAT